MNTISLPHMHLFLSSNSIIQSTRNVSKHKWSGQKCVRCCHGGPIQNYSASVEWFDHCLFSNYDITTNNEGIDDIDPSRAPSLMVFVCDRVVNEWILFSSTKYI